MPVHGLNILRYVWSSLCVFFIKVWVILETQGCGSIQVKRVSTLWLFTGHHRQTHPKRYQCLSPFRPVSRRYFQLYFDCSKQQHQHCHFHGWRDGTSYYTCKCRPCVQQQTRFQRQRFFTTINPTPTFFCNRLSCLKAQTLSTWRQCYGFLIQQQTNMRVCLQWCIGIAWNQRYDGRYQLIYAWWYIGSASHRRSSAEHRIEATALLQQKEDLTADQIIAFADLFEQNTARANTYMALVCDDVWKLWVQKQLVELGFPIVGRSEA